MKREYEKPEVEMISLIAAEEITDEILDGSMGLGEGDIQSVQL